MGTLKNTIKKSLGSAAVATGFLRRSLSDHGLILAFHRVNDKFDDGLTCSSTFFSDLCKLISSNFTPVSLTSFVERINSGKETSNLVAFTFDDGYVDNYEVAAPILKRFKIPATFYVVHDYINSDIIPWWDESLKEKTRWMTWDEVKTLEKEGFEIGSHTLDHPDLGKLTGEDAHANIALSKAKISEIVGKEILHFAYPYGAKTNMSEENRTIVKNSGYVSCVSCHGGTLPQNPDVFNLPRLPIGNWFKSVEQLALELSLKRV